MINTKYKKGFTLLEAVIYIALLSVIIGVGVSTTFGLLETSSKTRDSALKNDEILFVLQKLQWVIDTTTSENPIVVRLIGHSLEIKIGSTEPVIFTSQDLKVDDSKTEKNRITIVIDSEAYTVTPIIWN